MDEEKGRSRSQAEACAACKYRRRKCSKDCIYAPYFPSHQSKIFLDAHRLFGVSNIKRILMKVKEEERDDAMRSVIYESSIRAQFPVHGCWGITCLLYSEIERATQQLHQVQALLHFFRKLDTKKGVYDFCDTNVDADNEMVVPSVCLDSVQQENENENENDI